MMCGLICGQAGVAFGIISIHSVFFVERMREVYEAQQKYMRGMAQQYYMYQAMWQAMRSGRSQQPLFLR
eukprot:356237-Amphidinium_carterae.1